MERARDSVGILWGRVRSPSEERRSALLAGTVKILTNKRLVCSYGAGRDSLVTAAHRKQQGSVAVSWGLRGKNALLTHHHCRRNVAGRFKVTRNFRQNAGWPFFAKNIEYYFHRGVTFLFTFFHTVSASSAFFQYYFLDTSFANRVNAQPASLKLSTVIEIGADGMIHFRQDWEQLQTTRSATSTVASGCDTDNFHCYPFNVAE